MCGRYVLTTPSDELVEFFGVDHSVVEPAEPRFNVAPTQLVPAVACESDGTTRRLEQFRWGLVPPWAESPAVGNRMINARAETLMSSRAYRDAFVKRRCLLPADGFYEWQRPEGGGRAPRLPWYFAPREGPLLALAGLWERWRHPEGAWLLTCTVITTRANSLMAPVHERMPVLLAPEDFSRWLERRPLTPAEQAALLAPAPEDFLTARRVPSDVSNVKNDGPQLLAEVAG
ncbi:MAG TPA: SOS response-associated peptidase [Acidimicrobiales bacterium]|nr:SOS response-associated peptidase [Acidimicrobiales bacterium]